MAEQNKTVVPESRLAIFIDAENTSPEAVGKVIVSCASLGRTNILRAYGDWTIDSLKSWRGIFSEYPITPVQQFHYVSGKNSSDSAMNIEAMDIMHHGGVDTFVLVTSDSDFTRLATRAREEGLQVVGFGKKTTVQSFVRACHQFIYLENLPSLEQKIEGPPEPESPKPKRKKATTSKVTTSEEQQPELGEVSLAVKISPIDAMASGRELLLKAAQAWPSEDGVITGSQLGFLLRRLDPGFSPYNYGVAKMSDLVTLHPDVIKPTGKRSGLSDPFYRFEPQPLPGEESK
ncbi:MAG: NYN domain-containing protein [Nitrososphaerota archaeon]|nr:NYN domain-containing protein [Nitrososphaerota archaeon]